MKNISKQDAKDIGENLGINWNKVNLEEFRKGIIVEFEHGSRYPETNLTNDNKEMTGKIAWAHLKEFPDYYTRLEIMEKEAEDYWKNKVAIIG